MTRWVTKAVSRNVYRRTLVLFDHATEWRVRRRVFRATKRAIDEQRRQAHFDLLHGLQQDTR